MRILKSLAKSVAAALTAGPRGQRLLQWVDRHCQSLLGVGSGSEVAESGERAVFRLLLRRRPPPLVVCDVGANRGQFLGMAMAALGGVPHSIHCFEPGRATFEMLRRAHGTAPGVTFNNVAVGRASGEATLWYDEEGSGIASLTRRDLAHFGTSFDKSETVRTVALDDYASSHGIERIDLLKLDIEGHELDALAGAQGLIGRGAVGMVLFEFGGCNIDTRTYFRDFWKLLTSAGMRLHRITPAGSLFPIPAYDEILEQFRTTNFLAVSER